MIFQGRAVLVYLEEDNIARAFFRIRPLMMQDGPLSAEQIAEFPDHGYLRIVPDKNEQHTFKERMRSLSGLCLMDLRHLQPEANKIRTNKNYSPARDETNQFIIYSDAIRALPNDLCYQVVSASDAKSAATPLIYLRSGATIQGPFNKDDDLTNAQGTLLPPDSTALYALTLPEQKEILIYWPKEAEQEKATAAEDPQPSEETTSQSTELASLAPEKQPGDAPDVPPAESAYAKIQEMNFTLSENANRLKPIASPAPVSDLPQQPQKPLTGTRLYQAPQRQTAAKRAYNPLMEAVDQQRYAAKREAPGAVLPQNARLMDVSNPVDVFKRSLQGLWHSVDAQQQAVDVLLSQPQMRLMLSKAIAADNHNATITAMKTQLQDLEAERLMTLMQLDDAKKNVAAFREEVLSDLSKEQQYRVNEMRRAEQQARQALEAAQAALEPLNQKCKAAAEQLAALQRPFADHPIAVIAPASGKEVARDELIDRVESSLKCAGFTVNRGDACSLLALYALSDGVFAIRSASDEDAWTAYQAFANALGVSILALDPLSPPHILACGNAPILLKHSISEKHPLVTVVSLHAEDHHIQKSTSDMLVPTAVLEASVDAIPAQLPAFSPVSKACILKEILTQSPLHDDTLSFVLALRSTLKDAGHPLPLQCVTLLLRYISAVQNDLLGGVAEAIDRGVASFAAPYIRKHHINNDAVKALFASLPRTMKELNLNE